MSAVWEDPRVSRGTERMLAARGARLHGGARAIGWKVAFGAPAAQARFGIGAPLVGFLTDATRLTDGASVSISGWAKPALEPELAIHLGADVAAGADAATAAAAIRALGPAVELADADPALDDLEEIVAANIYHRAVILGPPVTARAGGDARGLRTAVTIDGEEVAATDDPTAQCGELVPIVRHVAELLGAAGARLRAGDVVIAGSVTPLVWLTPGRSVGVDHGLLGRLSVTIEQEDVA